MSLEWNRYSLIKKVSFAGSVLVNYSYLADGTKVSALRSDGSGLMYRGSLTYTCTGGSPASLEGVAFDGGRFVAVGNSSGGAAMTPMLYVTDHLGSVRAVVNGTSGAVVETCDYYPFGGRWDDSAALTDATNRYRYNSKEEQALFSTPYSDYGARQYHATTGSWLSIDPLADKYYSISPYAFCANNPVNLVDWDGKDIWVINSKGVISWVEKSVDHQLYSLNSEGYRSVQYISVENRSILDAFSDKTGIASYTTGSNIDDIYKVFLFAANNSEVEWVVHRGQDNMYTIGTVHNKNSAGSWDDYGINKPIVSLHSHPGVSDKYVAELESMGYFDNILLGDRKSVVKDVDVNGKQTRYNYVYFKNTGHLYHVEYYRPRFIKSVSNYRQFYFGTLNHK